MMPAPDDKPQAAPPDPAAADDRTIGQILGLEQAAPRPAPGFATMADEEDALVDPTAGVVPSQVRPQPAPPSTEPPGGVPVDEMVALNEQRRQIYDQQRARYPGSQAPRAPITPSDADIQPGHVTYESRIQIVDAWRYPGRLPPDTPAWIDRNWVGYADDDPIRNIPAGPCLRVPSSADPNEAVLARIGDYVCRQAVLLGDGPHGEQVIRIEVWAAEQFTRLFVPVARKQAPPAARATSAATSVPSTPAKKAAPRSSRQRSRGKAAA